MTTTKHMLVLANSIKHWPGVCVAGREIRSGGSQYTVGPWIRPVSSHGEGELFPSECQLSNGRQPRVMDFVEISLANGSNDPHQPENWLIEAGTRWRPVNGQYQRPSLDLLIEEPPSLWLQHDERSDRVSSDHLHRNPPDQSLYLVRVQNLRARFEWNEWDGRYKQRRRALFHYNGIEYECNITDPQFSEKHRFRFPDKGQPSNTFSITSATGCHLCVSLAPEFNRYHYKVVATILD
jgi:Dual OB-containing domain